MVITPVLVQKEVHQKTNQYANSKCYRSTTEHQKNLLIWTLADFSLLMNIIQTFTLIKCNNFFIGQTLLQTGKTKSCGCLQETQIYENLKLCEGTSVAILEASKRNLLKSNKSGYTGVYQKPNGRWSAQITFKRKTYYLGTYDDIKDAVKARKRGEEMHDEFLEWYYSRNEDAYGQVENKSR